MDFAEKALDASTTLSMNGKIINDFHTSSVRPEPRRRGTSVKSPCKPDPLACRVGREFLVFRAARQT
jgi:hypothetical protein